MREIWIPRFLFLLTSVAAYVLAGIVIAAPWLAESTALPDGWGQVVSLFAQNQTVRRTALASAIGLFVTAVVFFRSSPPPPRDRSKPPTPPAPSDQFAGA
jgi:hypothetical protein